MNVGEVKRLISPAFDSMLTRSERRSLKFRIERIGELNRGLDDDDVIEDNATCVGWRIMGEKGWSGSLSLADGPDDLVAFVQSDLQDFIAESRFAWGELRLPRDLP